MTRTSGGFTLVELLAVIAIIGLLAAVLLPTTSAARAAACRAKTRVMFAQWATAIESFRQEYGRYPSLDASGLGANKVNGETAAGTDMALPHAFHDVLAGVRRDGAGFSGAENAAMENVRRVSFISFTDADLGPEHAPETAIRGLVHDAFNNPDIAVLVDRNLDGRITAGDDGDVAALPFVSPPDNLALRLRPDAADFPQGSGSGGGVRTGVLFYCAPPGALAPADLVLSWK